MTRLLAALTAATPCAVQAAAVPKVPAVTWPAWSFPTGQDAGLTAAVSAAGPHGVAQVAGHVFRISLTRGRTWIRHTFRRITS